MSRRLLALLLILAGCGSPPPPTLPQQIAVLPAQTTPAQLGWWRYLGGDAEGAAAAFAQAPDDALAALGRARLAQDALDVRRTLAESARAAKLAGDAGTIAAVGQAWAARAATRLRDGKTLAKQALGAAARTPIKAHQHTVRVSFLPFLHLPRLHAAPPVLLGDQIKALGKHWALQTRRPKADADGLVLSTFSLPTGPVPLEVQVRGPAIAWRDGVVVAATPLAGHGPAILRFVAAGTGPLVLGWAADRHPRIWRHHAQVPAADDRPGPPVAERGPGVDWPWRYLHAELALLDGDAETAAQHLADAPQSPAFAMQRARLADITPDTPPGAARDQAQAAWQQAVDFAPARAHLALARIAWRQADPASARSHLKAVLARAPDAFFAHQTSVRLHLSEGEVEAAHRALEAARRAAANPCTLLADQAALADARAGSDAVLIAAYQRCKRPLDAADRLLNRHQPQRALAVLDALPDAQRKRRKAKQLRARALLGLGRINDARAVWDALPDPSNQLVAADLALALGAPDGMDRLAKLVAKHPTSAPALELMVAHPQLSPFASLVLDSEAAITRWQATDPQPGPAVRVLDHSAMIFTVNGKSLRWVHEVLAIRSRDAAERFGEIGLPEDVRLVALYTRKQDGRRLYAEEVPEKETITLPDLSTGDFVVAQYLDTGDNGYLYNSGFLTPRVYFQGVDLPAFFQRFEVYAKDRPTVHRLAGAPTPKAVQLGDRKGIRMQTGPVPLLTAEADTPPAPLWLPSARAGHAVVLTDDLAYLRDRVLKVRRRTPAFDAWVRSTVGKGTQAERINRLTRAIRERIEDSDGLMETPVAEALARGSGNRALVLSAALELLGVRHRLLTARVRSHVPSGPFLTVADFAYPLVQMGETIIDPGPERAAAGFFPFTLVGGDALVAWPPEAPTRPVALPTQRSVPDRRRVTVDLKWRKDGTLEGAVVDRIEGQEAIVVGHHLARLEPALRPRLVERLLVGVVGAAQVTALDDPTRQDPDGPLVLRYRFTAKVDDALTLGIFPAQPGRSYASRATRTLPLAINLPTDQIVTLRLDAERDFKGTLTPGVIAEGPYRFELTVDQDDDALTATTRTLIPGGVIPVADYAAFQRWAQAVDAAEQVRLTVTPR